MSDYSTDFRIPAGIPTHTNAEQWPLVDSAMRYLSRPPIWEPPPSWEPPAVTPADVALADPPPAGPLPASPPPASPASASAVEVRRSVEGLLRLALEVLDRRRRPDQLKGMATQPVIDVLAAMSVSNPPGRGLGAAALRKIRIVSTGDGAAEICASYARGTRVFAIAGRIERQRGSWVATSLLLA